MGSGTAAATFFAVSGLLPKTLPIQRDWLRSLHVGYVDGCRVQVEGLENITSCNSSRATPMKVASESIIYDTGRAWTYNVLIRNNCAQVKSKHITT